MTASTVLHTSVSGLYAQPQTPIDGGRQGADLRQIVVTKALATTSIDETGDIILMCPVNWTDRITSIKIFNDDCDSHSTPTAAMDVGLYKVNPQDGTVTVLDADVYATAITSLQAAVTTGTEIAFEVRDINKIGQTVLTDAGLTAVPLNAIPVIGFTITTTAATPVAGDVSLVVQFTN